MKLQSNSRTSQGNSTFPENPEICYIPTRVWDFRNLPLSGCVTCWNSCEKSSWTCIWKLIKSKKWLKLLDKTNIIQCTCKITQSKLEWTKVAINLAVNNYKNCLWWDRNFEAQSVRHPLRNQSHQSAMKIFNNGHFINLHRNIQRWTFYQFPKIYKCPAFLSNQIAEVL